jgi:hypothetical protein
LKSEKPLAELLRRGGEPFRYCDHIIEKDKAFFDAVRQARLEARSQSGETHHTPACGITIGSKSSACAHDFVIGGWTSDSDNQISALLLGEFIDGDLRYVGQVGSPSDELNVSTPSDFADDLVDKPPKRGASQVAVMCEVQELD